MQKKLAVETGYEATASYTSQTQSQESPTDHAKAGVLRYTVIMVTCVHRCPTIVSLEGLVHGEVAGNSKAPGSGLAALGGLQLQHLQQTILATTGDPALAGVPRQTTQPGVIGYGNLQSETALLKWIPHSLREARFPTGLVTVWRKVSLACETSLLTCTSMY